MSETNAPDWPEIETVMTNLDHSILEDAAQLLVGKQVVTRYPGWHFNALVWHDGETFCCEVWTFRVRREVIRCASLEEIMETVSNKYGWD